MSIRKLLRIWKIIYSNWKYSLSLLIIGALFFVLNVIIRHLKEITANYSSLGFFGILQFIFNLSIGFKQTVFLSTFTTIIIISLLTGMLLTLTFYKTKALTIHGSKKKTGVIASIGLFLGIAAPGCAACGVGILALFGVTAAALSALPLKGLEISLLAIAILGFSVVYVSKSLLNCETCKIQLNSNQKDRFK